ncbi:MAG: hypothetical protein ACPGJI_00895 [Kangiellaceae bacterium]
MADNNSGLNQLSSLQQDAIGEVLNIGMGAAGAALSEMVNHEVSLSVPYVELLDQEIAIKHIKEANGENFKAVKEGFSGAFGGEALLFFSESHSKDLVNILLSKDNLPLELAAEMEKEIITEIGNIILNACLGSLSNLFVKDLKLQLPSFVHGGYDTVINNAQKSNEHKDSILLLKMKFSLKDQNITGFITLLMAVDSAKALTKEVSETFGID